MKSYKQNQGGGVLKKLKKPAAIPPQGCAHTRQPRCINHRLLNGDGWPSQQGPMFAEGEGGFFEDCSLHLTCLETGDTIMERYSGLGTQIINLETQGHVERLWIVGGFPDRGKIIIT